MHDTPFHDSDHFCLIWKESIQNCKSYKVDTEFGMDGWIETNIPQPPNNLFVRGYNNFFWAGVIQSLHKAI